MAGADDTGAVALAALEDTFHNLLIQIGSVLHGVSGRGQTLDNRHLAQSSTHMSNYVPKALDRFHDNIDQLENELVRAQIVIRRDLLLSRIKPVPTTEPASPQQNDQEMVDESSTKGETASNGHDADIKPATNDSNLTGQDEEAKVAPSGPAEDDLDAMFNDLTNPDPSGDDKASDSVKPEQSEKTMATADGGPSKQPSQAVSSDSNHIHATEDEADVSSLLPGLESYANDDNGMPDFPSGDFNGGQNGQRGDAQAFGNDFNFEDLINQDFGTGMDHTNDEVDYNQFDDDFFKL